MKPIEIPSPIPTAKAYRFGECIVMVEHHGDLMWHMSISHKRRYPTWDEIRDARYSLIPSDVTMAMLLPPKEKYVNLHPNCFHLHEIPPGPHAGDKKWMRRLADAAMEAYQAAQGRCGKHNPEHNPYCGAIDRPHYTCPDCPMDIVEAIEIALRELGEEI